MYEMTDINLAWNHFEVSLSEVLEEVAPVRKVQPNGKFKPWVKPATKSLMQQRDSKRTEAKITDEVETWSEYRKLRNKVVKETRNDRKDYYSRKYEKYEKEGDTASLFKLAKTQMGWASSGPPAMLIKDGDTITSPAQLANEQMNFFYNKNQKLLEEVQEQPDINPLETLKRCHKKWTEAGNSAQRMELNEISLASSARLIGKLGNSSAAGHDDLDAQIIKLAATNLMEPIQFLVNTSIRTKTFPTKGKLGRIIPLHKGKNLPRHKPSSYRPITLLPVVSKIIECAVQEQLVEHMVKQNFFHPQQHAYRKGFSTVTALLELSDRLFEAAELKQIGAAMSVDQSSAFDSLNHETLIRKLEIYGITGDTAEWIIS